jgi:HK97 gp10 family phage protein
MANQLPSISIEGGKELKDLLYGLSNKEIFSAAQKGLRAVGTKTARAARTHLRKNHGLDTGQMKKSLGIRALKTYKMDGRIVMFLGPRRGFSIPKRGGKKNHDPFYIAHLVEFGHAIAGTSGGRVKPYPFLRPAVDQNKSEFKNQMIAKVRESLLKTWAKAKRG